MTTSTRPEHRHRSAAEALAPSWLVKNMSVRPFGDGWWSFNPSLHHDRVDGVWRCVFRCANYSLPDGVPQMSPEARRGRAQTRNAIAILDPRRLELRGLHEMRELDDRPRSPSCCSLGFEDMRLFRTTRDGLSGIATALALNLEHPSTPEMVLCRIGASCDVVDAVPIRGPWSYRAQKNWSPFDGVASPRFLYSIERGIVMSDGGPLVGSPLSAPAGARPTSVIQAGTGRSGVEVRIMSSGGRAANPTPGPAPGAPAPGSTELRGGSQLVEIGRDRWLGIGHEMKLLQPYRKKFYWHTFYTCDGDGRILERSMPIKLSDRHNIEFAAGLAIDDRGGVAISFGTDDHESWIAVTDLAAIRRILRPVGQIADEKESA